MSYGFDKSDVIKELWEASYYVTVMSLLQCVEKQNKSVFGISPARAGHIASVLSKYSHVEEWYYDEEFKLYAFSVVDVLIPYKEYRDITSLFHYAVNIGVPGWHKPDDAEINSYLDAWTEQLLAYFAERDRMVSEAVRLAEREEVLLQRIQEYVAECEAKGEKPVKRRMVDEEFTQNIVSKVWKHFEAEKLT